MGCVTLDEAEVMSAEVIRLLDSAGARAIYRKELKAQIDSLEEKIVDSSMVLESKRTELVRLWIALREQESNYTEWALDSEAKCLGKLATASENQIHRLEILIDVVPSSKC